ncbi:MAG: hypothetical protein WBM02_02920 [bacterium]
MVWKKRQKKTTQKKQRQTSPGNSPIISLDTLRKDFTNPEKLQRAMEHLGESIRYEPELASLRFPHAKLMEALDQLAETSSDELESIPDLLNRRMTILNRTLPPFLTPAFEQFIEDKLMERLSLVKKSPEKFRAACAGLYFLEIHRRQRDNPGGNPLWNFMFEISYDEAMAAAHKADKDTPSSSDSSGPTIAGSDFSTLIPDDLSQDSTETQKDALKLIESGAVELLFSLDSILLGLHELALNKDTAIEQIVQKLRESFKKEIGFRQGNDLAESLEQALESLSGKDKDNHEIVLKAIKLLPPRENPVVFAAYVNNVKHYQRHLDPKTTELVKIIMQKPDEAEAILDLGRYYLTCDEITRALNVFIAASTLFPAEEMARFGAGIACRLDGSFREARLHWNRAARLWSGYLPDHHPIFAIINELVELDDDADLPTKALDYLFFTESAP